ncbi:MAG: DegT/DnrJ/EryC1/StrS family aminotransferase [Spirochaetaceae bacterium]|jgi:dTDP-4-amino-4,6-dideoxygalactose transaminase|nr:DegT/DnrJ/EryC1/StrS family aminotransferase [Spirochaetaceae bacterium]
MIIEVHSPTIRRKEMDAVLTQLVEEHIGPGEQARRLIQIAKEHLQFDYALALRSPAEALALALSLVCGEDARTGYALISALSPRYYLRSLANAGIKPLFCDVEEGTACVSAATVRAALERAVGEVRCLVIHETLGFLPEMQPLCDLGIPLIEDCSMAYGSHFDERRAGSFGTFSILGLEERDMLTAGGGALLFAMDRRDAAVVRNIAALPPEYGLPDMNAAMALVQFRETGRNTEKRATLAQLYTDAALRGGRHKLIVRPPSLNYNNYAFPLVLESGMKDVVSYAKKKEIEVEHAFENSIAGFGLLQAGECPNAASLALRTALFPLYPRLAQESAQRVARLIQTLP